jgi:tetratricopeptide (TPR) repeat protein
MLDHYLHTACAADRLLCPHRDPITLSPCLPGVNSEDFADNTQALTWFTTEHTVLLTAVSYAAGAGWDAHAGQLAWAMADFLDLGGHWHDYTATQHAALEAAHRLVDPSMQACAHRLLGRAYSQLGRLGDADTHLGHALDLYRRCNDQVGQAHTHHNVTYALERQGRHAEALGHATRAVDLFLAAGHQAGRAAALSTTGWCHALLGDYQQALTICQQSLSHLQELGNCLGQAHTWDSLGFIHHHLGHYVEAVTCYQRATDLFRGLHERREEAITLTRLGDTHHADREPDRASDIWHAAATILDELNHPDAERVRARLQ